MVSNKESLSTSREDWIDAIRALAISFVVYGHAARGFDLFTTISGPIKMPLFFLISGYLFKSTTIKFSEYLLKTIRRIVVPWICLGMISCIPDLVRNFPYVFLESLYKLIVGQSFWFMPCFILSSIIYYSLRRVILRTRIWILISLLCGVLGLILTNHHIGDLLMLNRALHVQIYFAFGHIIKNVIQLLKSLSKFSVCSLWGIYIFLISISLLFYPYKAIDLHHCDYYVYWLSFPLIIIGGLAVFSSFSKINNIPLIISNIGKNTLVIYLLHGCSFFLFELLFRALMKDFLPFEIYGLIKTCFSLFLCSWISNVLRKYCPFIIGENNRL